MRIKDGRSFKASSTEYLILLVASQFVVEPKPVIGERTLYCS